jgi:hypothetical protein
MWRQGHRCHGAAVLLAVAVVLLIAGCDGSSPPAHRVRHDDIAEVGGIRARYRATVNGSAVVARAEVERAVRVLRARIRARGTDAFVRRDGDVISFDLPKYAGRLDNPTLRQLTGDGRIAFIDWEPNVLTPNGKTVASQLVAQDPTALQVSQGTASSTPGSAGDGSLGLYAAIKLAESVSDPAVGSFNLRPYPLYYGFAASGGPACQAAASYEAHTPLPREPCYVAGPARTRADLMAAVPPGISAGAVETLEVPRGVLVVEAVPGSFAAPAPISNPTTQFFTLLDQASILSSQVTGPGQSTDETGDPDVTFGFTAAGAAGFQSVTAAIAKRGAIDSDVGATLNQHFAVVFDDELLTVPSVDAQQYPDGIDGSSAEITGGFTVRSADSLADELRLGVLPVSLDLIGRARVPRRG